MKTLLALRTFLPGALLTVLVSGLVAVAQEMPGPGPEHAALKQLEGEWIATIKSPEGDSSGTMSAKLECGGLWLTTDFRADFGGLKFQGRGLDGYDPVKKKYVSVWVDSVTPRPMLLEGTMDAEKKTLTMTGEGPGPDGKPVKYKNVTHFPDNDHQTFTVNLVDADGKESKVMTIEYVRKK